MREFGLIGNPVSHSSSPAYFHQKWQSEGISDCRYLLFPLESLQGLSSLLDTHPDIVGLNVTSPFKQKILQMVDCVDTTASFLGSANVLRISRERKITAYNTDHIGFKRLLDDCPFLPESALVLGNGGASAAVRFCLEKRGIPYLRISRQGGNGRLSYTEVDKNILQSHRLIINATPLGMEPYSNCCPDLPYEFLSPQHLLIDLVYHPAESLFLQKGKAAGCTIRNGLSMLYAQADAAWEIWNRDRA